MTIATASGIDKEALFEEIGWVPHSGQRPVIRSLVRNRAVAAGRRFGKSEIGGNELVNEAMLTFGMKQMLEDMGKRREFWITGPEYSDAEKEFRVVYNTLKKLEMPFDRPGTYYDAIGGNLHISLWGGIYQVHGKSAKYPDSLVGEGLAGVIMAEAAKLKERVWSKYIRPTLADYRGWALLTSTPEGKNWFYERWKMGQDPARPTWDSWRMPSWRNPHVYRQRTQTKDVQEAMKFRQAGQPLPSALEARIDSEIIELMYDLTPETFNQEIGALFTEFVGRVFKDFDEEVHVGDFPFDPSWETYGAVDYGFTNPNVWLLIQVGPFGEVRVVGEFYRSGQTIDEFAIDVQANGLVPRSLIRFYPDPSSPADSTYLSKTFHANIGGGTGGELNERLDAIRKYLRVPRTLQYLPEGHPERIPKLMVDRRCVNLIREMSEYRYPKSAEEAKQQGRNAPELPMKKDDHAPEALGRFFAGHFGNANIEQAPRIRKSNMSRR